jgi:hypothetical protein
MPTTTEQPPAASLGPHPIFDALLSWEPEGGTLRTKYGLGHRDELAAPALEPDVVHDPRLVLRARVISSTPTGSLMLDMGPGRSVALHVGGEQ